MAFLKTWGGSSTRQPEYRKRDKGGRDGGGCPVMLRTVYMNINHQDSRAAKAEYKVEEGRGN